MPLPPALSVARILVLLSAQHQRSVRTFSTQSQYSRRRLSLRSLRMSAASRWRGVEGRGATCGAGAGCSMVGRSEARRGRCTERSGRSSRLLCISERIEAGEDTARLLYIRSASSRGRGDAP